MKSQISSQIFVYILAAVIIGLVVIFGYKAVKTIITTTSRTNIEEFKTEFADKIKAVSMQEGKVTSFELTLDKEYDQICFVDSRENGVFNIDSGIIQNYWIKKSVQENASPNVFLLENGEIMDAFYVDFLNVREDFKCFENKGVVWLKGQGKKTELYER